jgi:hypothetical protein
MYDAICDVSVRGLRNHCVIKLGNRPRLRNESGQEMGKQGERLLLAALGLGLLVGGHKLLDAELGQLGAPHAVGALLVTFALKA